MLLNAPRFPPCYRLIFAWLLRLHIKLLYLTDKYCMCLGKTSFARLLNLCIYPHVPKSLKKSWLRAPKPCFLPLPCISLMGCNGARLPCGPVGCVPWFVLFCPCYVVLSRKCTLFCRDQPASMGKEEPSPSSMFSSEENIALSLLGQTNWVLAGFHFSALAFHVSPFLPLFYILSLCINPVFISWQLCMSGPM